MGAWPVPCTSWSALAAVQDLEDVLHNKTAYVALDVLRERNDAKAFVAAVSAVAHRDATLPRASTRNSIHIT